MLTFAICDDEAHTLKKLGESMERYISYNKIDADIEEFSSGEALLETRKFFDIVLTDMKLPGKNGIEVAKQLRRSKNCGQIIFITSYREFAVQAFGVEAVHYLIKPVPEQDLFQALGRAVQRLDGEKKRTITITKGSSLQIIEIRSILYCEAINHRLYVHTESGCSECFGTLDRFADQLDENFFRCHKSYIVNLRYVIGKEQDTAILKGGERVLVSRRRQQEFTGRLLSYFRGEML